MLKNKKIILIVLISLSFLGLSVYFSKTALKNETAQISSSKNFHPIGQTYGNGTTPGGKTVLEINKLRYKDDVATEISVYDFMSKLRSERKINFTEKNYIGMGKFIVSINGIKGNGDENWIYYVNGIEAQVGVSNYKIKSGDIVSWKYEKANF